MFVYFYFVWLDDDFATFDTRFVDVVACDLLVLYCRHHHIVGISHSILSNISELLTVQSGEDWFLLISNIAVENFPTLAKTKTQIKHRTITKVC